ncbi:MAG: hypothetical protein HQL82_01815 [Magnetococcales bacterium]|nr:hypothetical protein [Magnetococcales bacterium]
MTEFDWTPPGNADDCFDLIEPLEVLYDFDGPGLFTFTWRTGLYLACFCDEIPGSFRHLIVPTTNRTVRQLKEGSCAVRDALIQEQDRMWIADLDGQGRCKTLWKLTSLDFPEDVLPVEGAILTGFFAEHQAKFFKPSLNSVIDPF